MMDANATNKLNDIKWEVYTIIRDLGGIADGLDRDFDNVGNNICASKIRSIRDDFNEVLRNLNNINTSNVEGQ